ncbi:MAG: MATE family efflux transporter [Lachnospiraceae bacterium]|nr:MATE family efflux transporter [Lachnospiraceae bacterium]
MSSESNQQETEISTRKHRGTREVDMLHGPLAGKLFLFALPLAISSILQQLFNSADLAVVGRFDSSQAMAAVGSNAALVNLLISLFSGLSVGANVVVASLIGQGRKKEISRAVHTVILLAIICGFIVCGLGLAIAPQLLRMMNTPDDVLHLAELYLRIYFIGMPFFMLYNFGSAIQRSKGDSTTPLVALIISGIVNVFLNLFFVIVCHLGVAGVAIATDISSGISAAIVIVTLARDEESYRLHVRELSIDGTDLKRIIAVGLPAGLQGMVFSLSNVVIQSGINSFGAAGIAGSTAGQNFEFMSYFVVNGFAQACVTFTSQNFAAGEIERCKKVNRLCMLIGLSCTLAVSAVFLAGRYLFIRVFTTDEEVITFAVLRMWFVCMPELLTGTYEIPGGALRGMNHSLTPTVITVLGSCVFRLIYIATVFQMNHEYWVLMVEYPISWVITGIACNIAYYRIRGKEFSRIRAARAEG